MAYWAIFYTQVFFSVGKGKKKKKKAKYKMNYYITILIKKEKENNINIEIFCGHLQTSSLFYTALYCFVL